MNETTHKHQILNATNGGAPVVTIGLPVYNGADKLRRTLDNLLNQTFQDFELIISDNASTDSTQAICEEYVRKDSRIRYIRQQKNIGAPANWNAVVYPARGRYFKWASANDTCESNYLELAVNTLDENPDAVLCYGQTELVDEAGASQSIYSSDPDVGDASPSERFAKVRQCLEMNNAQQGVIRTDILLKTKLDRLYPAGDMVLMAELALYGRFILLPQVLLHRSHGKHSMTCLLSEEKLQKVFNPSAQRPLRFIRGRTHLDYITSILRTPIRVKEKIKALKNCLMYIRWDRKDLWRELTGRRRLAGRPNPSRPIRIGLFGPYASANLGDTAIQMATMAALKKRFGAVEFLGITTVPEDAARTHRIDAVSMSGNGPTYRSKSAEPVGHGVNQRKDTFSFRGINRVVSSLDLIVLSGGGQLEDYWGGPWMMPFRLLSWSILARLHKVPVAVTAVGVDELRTRLGQWMIVQALKLADFRSFRDAGSQEILRSHGFKSPCVLSSDPAFTLTVNESDLTPKTERPYVVISPINRRAWSGQEDERYATYLQSLTSLCERLVEKGYAIRLANSQTGMDTQVSERVLSSVSETTKQQCQLEPIQTVEDFISVSAGAEVVVASRLHACILAFVAGTPVIALSPSRKLTRLMSDLNLEGYCSSLGEMNEDALYQLVSDALSNRETLRTQIEQNNRALQQSLNDMYDRLAATVEHKLEERLACHDRRLQVKVT